MVSFLSLLQVMSNEKKRRRGKSTVARRRAQISVEDFEGDFSACVKENTLDEKSMHASQIPPVMVVDNGSTSSGDSDGGDAPRRRNAAATGDAAAVRLSKRRMVSLDRAKAFDAKPMSEFIEYMSQERMRTASNSESGTTSVLKDQMQKMAMSECLLPEIIDVSGIRSGHARDIRKSKLQLQLDCGNDEKKMYSEVPQIRAESSSLFST